MTQIGRIHTWCLGITLQLILTPILLQAVATVSPTIKAQTTNKPQEEPSRPDKGTYVVNKNGTCLLASMALQLNITFSSISQNKTVQDVVNLQSGSTNSSGTCQSDSASLQLTTDAAKTNISFYFTLNTTTNHYYLSEVSVSAAWPDMKERILVHNRHLDFLRCTMGYSYMCRKEQTIIVGEGVSINTFEVQVQPFGLTGEQFGPAEECQLDEDDMLIPIIVGAALAGLVLVVLLAYLIGRKRSHAGYQTI